MPVYDVVVTADATISVTVQVEAKNKHEAEDIACSQARDSQFGLAWELDENYLYEVYCGSPGDCAEEVGA